MHVYAKITEFILIGTIGMEARQYVANAIMFIVFCLYCTTAISTEGTRVSKDISAVKADFENKSFRFQPAKGLGLTEGITRRDPSDVIKVGDTYFVWYTHVDQNKLPDKHKHLRASGYVGTVWYAESKDEGHTWTERGETLGTGSAGAFDSLAVFTPNIVKFYSRYWLYYTGVRLSPGKDVFENNSTDEFAAIGVAVADSPHGPFRRLTDKPILSPPPKSGNAARPSSFDSYRIDDAALLVRDYDGDSDMDIWLYYKGRNIDHGRAGPGKTKMGLAVADEPQGPYIRIHSGQPILADSHEVMIWPHRAGVAAYASKSRTLEFAPDGVDFTTNPIHALAIPRPIAPGCFRPDLTEPLAFGRGIAWGIFMEKPSGPYPYLLRYEIDLTLSE
jgi:hypothetical protein